LSAPDVQGMVDAGEEVSVALKREFGEETLNTMKLSEAEVRVYNIYIYI
jgi:hypothetical protein